MRCPKCGVMSFDWLHACAGCGKDLREVAAGLGLEDLSAGSVDWFDDAILEGGTKTMSPERHGEKSPPSDALSAIDVSDLVEPSGRDNGVTDLPDIDAEDVSRIAVDDDLNRTLDQVIEKTG